MKGGGRENETVIFFRAEGCDRLRGKVAEVCVGHIRCRFSGLENLVGFLPLGFLVPVGSSVKGWRVGVGGADAEECHSADLRGCDHVWAGVKCRRCGCLSRRC